MSLSVKNQSIDSSGITKDYKEAICEYIWNGFEANATEVRISNTPNECDGLNTISISDNGDGINYNNLSKSGAGNSCSVCTLHCRHYFYLNHSNLFLKIV